MLAVESLNADNVSEVADLEKHCFGEHAWSENLLKNEIGDPKKHYFVLRECGQVVAYGGFCQVLDEGDIMNICVDEKHRKKGYATKILRSFFDVADTLGLTAFTLEVRVSNDAARRLYEKNGFHFVGIRKNYYPDGEDCCIYWYYR